MTTNNSIPSAWKWVTLSDIGVISSGGTPSTRDPEFWSGNISWITPADLANFNEIYISEGRRNISDIGLENSSAVLLPANSVLFSTRAPIGYVAIAKKELATNQGFKNLILPPVINPKFVYYYLKSIKKIAESLASGTTFSELSAAKFKTISFPLAPKEEQDRIVEKIDELFSELENIERKLENEAINLLKLSKLYAAAVFNHQGKKTLTLDKVVTLKSGKNLSSNDRDGKGKHLVYGGNGILGTHSQYLFEEQQLIIGRVGENCGNIHITKEKSWITDNALIVNFKVKHNINFFKYYFSFLNFKKLAKSSSQPVISAGNIYKTEVFIPNLNEQNKIALAIEEKLQIVEKLKAHIIITKRKIDILRQKILHDAFLGKLSDRLLTDMSIETLLVQIGEENKTLNKRSSFSKKTKTKRSNLNLYEAIMNQFKKNSFSYSQLQALLNIEKNKLSVEFDRLLQQKSIGKFFEKESGSIKYKLL